jgi:hypothetical protein
MATKRDITDVIAGDDFGIDRVVSRVPAGVNVTKAWLTIKERVDDADADALLQITIAALGTNAGQITNVGYDTPQGRKADLTFELSKTDTLKLTPKKPYPYDIQLLFDNGKIGTSDIGAIIAKQGVTQATS